MTGVSVYKILVLPLIFLALAASSPTCPQGWYYHPIFGACYGVAAGGFSDSWDSAEKYCNSFGGHLPTIHSSEEFDFIQSYAYMAGDNVWSGFYTSNGGKTFASADKTETGFLNNATTNWCFGGYSNSLGKRCIAIGEAYGLKCIYDTDCEAMKMHTVCKKAVECLDQNGNTQIFPEDTWITNNCTTFNTCWKGKHIARSWPYQCDDEEQCVLKDGNEMCQSSKCDIGWRYYSKTSFCYKVLHNLNFIDGENLCQVKGGHLTSIHTMDENTFIMRMVQIGSTDVGFEDQTLLGGNTTYTPIQVGHWTDGTDVDLNNGMTWPNPYGLLTPASVAMYSDNATPGYGYLGGQWYMLANTTVLRNAVCKKKSFS